MLYIFALRIRGQDVAEKELTCTTPLSREALLIHANQMYAKYQDDSGYEVGFPPALFQVLQEDSAEMTQFLRIGMTPKTQWVDVTPDIEEILKIGEHFAQYMKILVLPMFGHLVPPAMDIARDIEYMLLSANLEKVYATIQQDGHKILNNHLLTKWLRENLFANGEIPPELMNAEERKLYFRQKLAAIDD